MPLTTPAARERLHLRRVSYEGFRRDDGLFDIDAKLVDTKDYVYPLAAGTRTPDEPVHVMHVRVTINTRFDVLDIDAATDEMPYPGQCNRITPEYKKLIGSNLLRGFRKSIAEQLGGVKGCTHLSELLSFLPTAAVHRFNWTPAMRSTRAAKRSGLFIQSGTQEASLLPPRDPLRQLLSVKIALFHVPA
jgi:hypothetical protein